VGQRAIELGHSTSQLLGANSCDPRVAVELIQGMQPGGRRGLDHLVVGRPAESLAVLSLSRRFRLRKIAPIPDPGIGRELLNDQRVLGPRLAQFVLLFLGSSGAALGFRAPPLGLGARLTTRAAIGGRRLGRHR
jgi:hypothetical protein